MKYVTPQIEKLSIRPEIIIAASSPGNHIPAGEPFEMIQNPKYPGEKWLRHVQEAIADNRIVFIKELLVELGVEPEFVEQADFLTLLDYWPFDSPVDKIYKKRFRSCVLTLATWHKLKYSDLSSCSLENPNLNLAASEFIIENTCDSVYVLEEKVVRKDVSYGGIRWSNGPIKLGTISYSAEDIVAFKQIGYGNPTITNKRILLLDDDDKVIKSVKIPTIVSMNVYGDALMLNLENTKSILLKVPVMKGVKVHPDIFSLALGLQRVMDGTYSRNL